MDIRRAMVTSFPGSVSRVSDSGQKASMGDREKWTRDHDLDPVKSPGLTGRRHGLMIHEP
jgi:hypothetical protein